MSIPSTIGNLQNLVSLSLARNGLEGSIPVSIENMISLVTLDFSYNNISGSVPKSLQALQYLIYFNVSFNALSGEIPSGGPFVNFTMESFIGNEALCGIPRLNIMIDVAMALGYLHLGYSTPTVHCLKPSNILLDEEMVAHVSDFGVSKLLGNEESIVLTNTLATLGYNAPDDLNEDDCTGWADNSSTDCIEITETATLAALRKLR
ncbi:receptor kinase-like protein Xa21 [Salvia miltiorrhiza]|uniref:receptor kinase-like protein Xa21 n=1 Tax=Salvia miltiorrhiza TaxID=226208 RepID=UPI0025AC2578|nr:receptor kinase-like protein Xa21 [Salvia miltiorrhiza]